MSPIFNKGETLFCFWQEEKVVATMGVIVKDISYKGEIL